MLKFNLGGDVMSEFERIASEKGWIVKTSYKMPEKFPVKSLYDQKIINSPAEFQKYMRDLERAGTDMNTIHFQAFVAPAQFTPKMPSWMTTEPDQPPWTTGPEQPSYLPKGKEVLKDIDRGTKQKLLDNLLDRGYTKEQAVKELSEKFPTLFPQKLPAYLPKGEDVLKEVGERTRQRLLDNMLDKGYTKEQAMVELSKRFPMFFAQKIDDVEATMSKEKTLMKVSSVINELVSLANDLDEMGEKEAANSIDKQTLLYKEAVDKIYDVTGETGEKFIEICHPKKSVMVPAKDDGGLIENLVEQQEADLKVVKKSPTGKYAETIMKLIVTANKLEDEGNIEAAKLVDKAIAELREAALPFVSRNSTTEAVDSKDAKASLEKEAQDPAPTAMLKQLLGKIYAVMRIADRDEKTKMNYALGQFRLDMAKHIANLDRINIEQDNVENLSAYIKELELVLTTLEKYNELKGNIPFGSRVTISAVVDDTILHVKSAIQKTNGRIEAINEYGPSGQTMPQTKPAQPSRPVVSQGREFLINQYKGTLNTIKNAMSKNPQQAKKALGGDEAYAKLIDALNKELENVNKKSNEYLSKANNAVYNRLLFHLKKWKLANFAPILLKKGEEDLLSLLNKLPAPSTATGKVPKKRVTPAVANKIKDPLIVSLQQALISAGIDVGTHKDDGMWGPDTMTAWNVLVGKVNEMFGDRPTGLVEKRNPGMGGKPSSGEISLAIKATNIIGKQTESTQAEFVINGEKFTAKDLRDPRSFLAALAMNNLILKDYENLKKPQIVEVVGKNLNALWQDLTEGKQGEYIKFKYGEQAYNSIIESIKNLWAQFQKTDWEKAPKQTDIPAPGGKVQQTPGQAPAQPGAQTQGIPAAETIRSTTTSIPYLRESSIKDFRDAMIYSNQLAVLVNGRMFDSFTNFKSVARKETDRTDEDVRKSVKEMYDKYTNNASIITRKLMQIRALGQVPKAYEGEYEKALGNAQQVSNLLEKNILPGLGI